MHARLMHQSHKLLPREKHDLRYKNQQTSNTCNCHVWFLPLASHHVTDYHITTKDCSSIYLCNHRVPSTNPNSASTSNQTKSCSTNQDQGPPVNHPRLASLIESSVFFYFLHYKNIYRKNISIITKKRIIL